MLPLMALSVQAFAEQCSTLNIAPVQVNGQEKILVLAAHNGVKINQSFKNSEFKALANDGSTYYLAPGAHSFQVKEWDKSRFLKFKRALAKLKKNEIGGYTRQLKMEDTKNYNLQLNVTVNNDYTFKLTKNGNDTKLIVNSSAIGSTECPEASEKFYAAKDSAVQQNTQVFPGSLEYRLRYTMFKLLTQNTTNNYLPLKDANYFGAVFSNHGGKKGIKVLSVLPFSLAGKLTLASGDVIVSLGDKKVKGENNPDKQIADYFTTLEYGQEMTFTVLRNGSKKVLTKKYLPLFIPESSYIIGDGSSENRNAMVSYTNNLSDVSNNLALEYEQLLLELTAYYDKQNQSELHNVSIVRDKTKTPFLGFGLKNTKSGGGFVTNVILGGQGDKLGLVSGDVILKLNEANLEVESARQIANRFIHLQAGQPNVINVLRNGKKLSLKSDGQIVQMPGFVLNLDLLTTDNAKKDILLAIEEGRFSAGEDSLAKYTGRQSEGRHRTKDCMRNCGRNK